MKNTKELKELEDMGDGIDKFVLIHIINTTFTVIAGVGVIIIGVLQLLK